MKKRPAKKHSKSVDDSLDLTLKLLATIRRSGAMQMIAVGALKAALAHIEQLNASDDV